VGTHALSRSELPAAGFGCNDEQHRFGGGNVPPTAKVNLPCADDDGNADSDASANVAWGLDVSQIDELPPGRQKFIRQCYREGRSHAYDLIRREVAQGRQAYIVLPWLKNQKSWMFVQLLRSINGFRKASSQFQVGLLHGHQPER